MITAETLKTLTAFDARALTSLIRKAGYKEDSFVSARFLGMTNGAQFCYSCTYKGEFEDVCKVFVYVDKTGVTRAEY